MMLVLDYPPTGSRSLETVLRAAEAEWMLNRKTRYVQECEHQLQGKSALEWTEEEHKKLERFLRYRTTAERSFYRARQVLEQTRRNAVIEGLQRERLDLQKERAEWICG